MTLKVDNETLLNHLSTGDASSNELYYHVKCNKSLWNQCIKLDKENSGHNIEMKWRQVQAYENIITFVLEQEAIEPDSMFVFFLKSFGIEEKKQTTRFTQWLLNSIPNLVSSTVNKNTVVLFGDKVGELIVDYVKNPDESWLMEKWLLVINPVRKLFQLSKQLYHRGVSHLKEELNWKNRL